MIKHQRESLTSSVAEMATRSQTHSPRPEVTIVTPARTGHCIRLCATHPAHPPHSTVAGCGVRVWRRAGAAVHAWLNHSNCCHLPPPSGYLNVARTHRP